MTSISPLTPGRNLSIAFYIFACVPKWEHFASQNLLDRMPEVFPLSQRAPRFTPERVWELGMSYLKRLIYPWQGKS